MRSITPFLLLVVLATQGCVSSTEHQSKQLLAKVEAEGIKKGENPQIAIGMPIQEAKAFLERSSFQIERRAHTGSKLSNPEAAALHYVKIFPHPAPYVVLHHEVHVLLFHDGQRLTDIQSEAIYTTVD
jgi:hypothetical protein